MVLKKRGFFGVPGGYRNPPGKLMGLLGHSGGEEAGHGRWRPFGNPNWTMHGGASPFPSPSPLFPLSPSPLEGRGANPTRSGVLVGLPMARHP